MLEIKQVQENILAVSGVQNIIAEIQKNNAVTTSTGIGKFLADKQMLDILALGKTARITADIMINEARILSSTLNKIFADEQIRKKLITVLDISKNSITSIFAKTIHDYYSIMGSEGAHFFEKYFSDFEDISDVSIVENGDFIVESETIPQDQVKIVINEIADRITQNVREDQDSFFVEIRKSINTIKERPLQRIVKSILYHLLLGIIINAISNPIVNELSWHNQRPRVVVKEIQKEIIREISAEVDLESISVGGKVVV